MAFEIASGSLRPVREIESATSEREVILRERSKHSQYWLIRIWRIRWGLV